MRNQYKIEGNITIVYIDSPKNGVLKALIDTEDLKKLLDFEGTVTVNRSGKNHYVIISRQTEKRWDKLHRIVMNAPADKIVHHKNHDTLDNRKENLEIKTQAEHISEHSIARGKGYTITVRKRKSGDRYELSRCEGGLTVYYGLFETREEAETYGKQFKTWNIKYSKCSMAQAP